MVGPGIAEAINAELAAAKALSKIEGALYDGAKPNDVRALEKLLEKHEGTAVARRGRELLGFVRLALD